MLLGSRHQQRVFTTASPQVQSCPPHRTLFALHRTLSGRNPQSEDGGRYSVSHRGNSGLLSGCHGCWAYLLRCSMTVLSGGPAFGSGGSARAQLTGLCWQLTGCILCVHYIHRQFCSCLQVVGKVSPQALRARGSRKASCASSWRPIRVSHASWRLQPRFYPHAAYDKKKKVASLASP